MNIEDLEEALFKAIDEYKDEHLYFQLKPQITCMTSMSTGINNN